MVFTFKLFPYVYLYTSGAMGSIDSSLEEAAENLGSNKIRRLCTVTLPVVLPSIAAGAIMVFMTSLADFGTPMLIGEGYMVLPVLVYNEYMSEIGGNAHLGHRIISHHCAVLYYSAVGTEILFIPEELCNDGYASAEGRDPSWLEALFGNGSRAFGTV